MEEEPKNTETQAESPAEASTQETAPVAAASPYKNGFAKRLDGFFGISKAGSNFRTEIIAGIVTFMAMAYILTVNPNAIVGEGNPLWAPVFVATALGAIVGTLLMAFLARMPLAQASGMGLNYMVGGMIGGAATSSLGIEMTFGNVMLLVLISGLIFMLLSIVKIKGKAIRELIFDGVPECVRGAIAVGIGLFIAFIGMQNAGLIVSTAFIPNVGTPTAPVPLVDKTGWPQIIPGTLVDLTVFNVYGWDYIAGKAVICLIGLLSIAVLEHYKVKGGVIIGVIIATLIGIPMGVTTYAPNANPAITWKFWENFSNFFSMDPEKGGVFFAAFTEGFNWHGAGAAAIMPCIVTIISFCMIDMFDTMGTVVGCCVPAGLADEKGKPHNYNKIMMSDSIATCTGALFGTSTVTTFVESGSGIAAGGKTGLTALTTAILFLLSIFLLPLFASIPGPAAASALIYVGVLMMKSIKNIKVDTVKNAVPAFLTIAMMPLAYSITDGIGFGILSYVLIDLIVLLVDLIKYAAVGKKKGAEKPKWDLHVVTVVVAVLFLVYFFVPTKF